MSIASEIENRFDLCAFTMPDEFMFDEEVLDKENKLLLCRLYIDSFKVLTFEEYSALQGILIVSSCWDGTAQAPTHICGGMFHSFSEMPLTMKLIGKILNTDLEKMVVLLKNAFIKLPILKTMIPPSLMKEIDEMKTTSLKNPATGKIDKNNFDEIGQLIRKNLFRTDDGRIAYRKQKVNNTGE